MEQVTFDIEAMPNWQKDLVTGIRKGEMTIYMGGRQTGKSQLAAYSRLFNDIMSGNSKMLDMQLSEGTVYGSRYYTIEPIGGNWLEMETWCLDTFGSTGSIWQETKSLTPQPLQRWYANNRKFWFKEEKDRDWFILRWRS